ncbi:Zn(2+)-responsive transcriptional regulator [Shewanella sp. VB17]|uniref:Zn(2+)-responsive transcriptional regulator n=1 Tax=Shewanella sp. VB17 TaxID=2739432 RepID=UPI00156630BF|nr:Zn(2+)-responsive transcriptional regulator [Shewanella sp. VB17]NRD75542.1 Zn(2+)-responsive transcriptional regulator [Shewanella sp. VB17]
MYRIGELAKQSEVKADTLRFYEKHGLLAPSSRSDAGYRLYNEKDAERLRFILRAKAVGFTLAEIAELLSIELDKSNWACADVKGLVDVKLTQVNEKISELNYFKMSLQRLSDACCGGPESAEHCSILEALESNTDSIKCENKAHQHDELQYTKNCQSKGS